MVLKCFDKRSSHFDGSDISLKKYSSKNLSLFQYFTYFHAHFLWSNKMDLWLKYTTPIQIQGMILRHFIDDDAICPI